MAEVNKEEQVQVKIEETTGTSQEPKSSATSIKNEEVKKEEVRYFKCSACDLRERYDFFGNDPSFVKHYRLRENAYLIEDPFVPPKQGEFIILGAHCVVCGSPVCKDANCSMYYEGTYCIKCAKSCSQQFPQSVQDKLNKIIQ